MVESESPTGGGSGVPEEALFVHGVDYVSPWREAAGVAEDLNTAVVEAGVDPRLVRAVPHVGARGEPVVRLQLEDARVITCALRVAAGLAIGLSARQRTAGKREGDQDESG